MNKTNQSPSKLAIRFFRWYCHPDYAEDIEGDLLERFEKRTEKSLFYARWKFIVDVLALFRPGIIRPFEGTQKLNYYGMLKNDLLIGWRSLLKNKSYSILNISGLAIGIAVAITILIWINDELSYNKYYQNYDSIGKLARFDTINNEVSISRVMPTGVGTLMSSEYRNYFDKVAIIRWRIEQNTISYQDNHFNQEGYFIQPEGPELLSLEMVFGSRNGLDGKSSLLISESLSKRLFKDQNPVGEIIKMDGKYPMEIIGVYRDLPENADYHDAQFFGPLDYFLWGWSDLNVWDNYNMNVLVKLKEDKTFEEASAAIKDAMKAHLSGRALERNPTLFVIPMKDWRLYDHYEDGKKATSGRLKMLWIYGITGLFILVLACINFVNLNTARASNRMKEIGVRKSMGAKKSRLVVQFLVESFIVTFISAALAMCLLTLTTPWFNWIMDRSLIIPIYSSWFWLALFVFLIVTTIAAGGYPAFYLSNFEPIRSLKGKLKTGKLTAIPRKALVIFQFSISISLIIGTLLISRQIEFAKSRPIGYNTDRLISMKPGTQDYYEKKETLRNELLKTGVVVETAATNYEVTSTLGWNNGISWAGKDPDQKAEFNTIRVSPEYGKTIGLEFTAGRDFMDGLASDKNNVIINESAADLFVGMEKPIVGQTIKFDNDSYGGPYFKIIGITKDMVKGSPFQETYPSILFPSDNYLSFFYIRINPNVDMREAIGEIEETFKQVLPTTPFDFKFADVAYNAKFLEEERTYSLVKFLSAIAIVISCMGLFGLASYITEQRTKEIGIRKVLGASIFQIWQLLTKDFIVLIGSACLISIPIAFYAIQNWLDRYSYKTDIDFNILILGGISAIMLTVLVVSFRTIYAANSNPVESLKDE